MHQVPAELPLLELQVLLPVAPYSLAASW